MLKDRTNYIVLTFASYLIADSIALLSDSTLYKTFPPVPTFCEIANTCGIPCEDFNITTDDGYIIQQFHIPGDPSKPVLLVPGVMESAEAFIERKNISLVLTLAKEKYDVWIANNRGTRYGRRHIQLNPDKDEKFWDFTIEEMAVYDLPPTIDYVLNKTNQSSLSIIGHSQGTTLIFVLLSENPEYNPKVRVLGCLAAIAYLDHVEGRLQQGIMLSPFLDPAGELLQYEEVIGFYSDEKSIIRKSCNSSASYELCVTNGFFRGAGPDPEQFEPEFLPTYVSYFPGGTSRKNLIHYGQIGNRKKFAKYDYGLLKNKEVYGTEIPPEYNLTNVKTAVALYRGQNDYISVKEDVDRLKQQLPNVVEDVTIEYQNWNHIDYVIGLYMPKYLYPHLLSLLSKYN